MINPCGLITFILKNCSTDDTDCHFSLFTQNFNGILFDGVLGEVGAAHEVGGWHAFFACELDLVEVDVAVEDCDF